MREIGVITNPNSKKNRRHQRKLDDLRRIVGPRGLVRQTATTEEIADVLREFIDNGVRYWVSDGGDGALHWMLNEGRRALGADFPLPLIVPTNGGTIDFVAQKAHVRGHARSILQTIVRSEERRTPFDVVEVDTMHLEGETLDGRPFDRIGFACAIAGVGQNFFDKYYMDELPGPQTILRIFGITIAGFFIKMTPLQHLPMISPDFLNYPDDLFRAKPARVFIDGEEMPWREYRAIHAGAIDIHLGNLKVFPLAAEPGRLNFHAGAVSPLDIVKNVPNLFAGRPIVADDFFDGGGEEMIVEALGTETLDPVIDGELYHGLKRLRITPGPRVPVPRIQA
ncbi:MAG: hypothetical protein KC609_01010 [Myxococcales bacterium]|nr:hypothetical protein [Myxococcales bacterium]